jgi:hypothetical protein
VRIEHDLHGVPATADGHEVRPTALMSSLMRCRDCVSRAALLSSMPSHVARKRPGRHPEHLLEFSSKMSLIAEVQHVCDLAELRASRNQLSCLRYPHLTHIHLRCHPHRIAENSDKMALVHLQFARELLGSHCTCAVLPEVHTGSARQRAGVFVRGVRRKVAGGWIFNISALARRLYSWLITD